MHNQCLLRQAFQALILIWPCAASTQTLAPHLLVVQHCMNGNAERRHVLRCMDAGLADSF